MKLIKLLLFTFLIGRVQFSAAQNKIPAFPDSILVTVHPQYNEVGKTHRWLFGENYRKDWALQVRLPLIRLSQLYGGLKPMRQGGGMESKTLRLEDPSGKEWVLRSVEKIPDKLLPENLQGTFAVDWVGDEFSGQHPFSALVVPPLAETAGIPHANPIIGVVAADTLLGKYSAIFTGLICLLEEREPAGVSDNTQKMERELIKSHDNRLNGELFLRARMLDLLLGDWDRHEDQWRWAPVRSFNGKIYQPVPRDRDQVFHVTEGVFPTIAALPWLDPVLENFDGNIPRVKYSLFKTRFLKNFTDSHFSYAEWMRIVNEFVTAETDEVLEKGLKRLPVEDYRLRHDMLFSKLKMRRDHIAAAMTQYYLFINRIVDIRTSDNSEDILITDGPDHALRVRIEKMCGDSRKKQPLMNKIFHPDTTKEIRIYLSGGDDHVLVDNSNSSVKLRFVDSTGNKTYEIRRSKKAIPIYGSQPGTIPFDPGSRIIDRTSADSSAMKFVASNLYDVWMPLATATINADDGFLLGLGFRYKGVSGFRKLPYSTIQTLLVTHSFSTNAFSVKYNGEWIQVFGKADFVLQAYGQAPDNTMNFFGKGNNTSLDKNGDYHRFYRARFDLYQADPQLRWQLGKKATFSAGPSFQFYHPAMNGNSGRFIERTGLINNYDSLIIAKDKAHIGIALKLESDHRNNPVLPSVGYFLKANLQAYDGLNSNSEPFLQIRPELTVYQRLNPSSSIVLSDRVGGGIGFGRPAFYQSMFLGGQGNLLGYLQNRFAGQHMLFNNFQARLRIASIASYIIPGQLGITGFFDTGRVWVNDEKSNTWHYGSGGGLYFAPASLTVLQILAGHSNEGWYPYISLNFRI